MSVYVGIDVHRKRSQLAVVAEHGTVQLNKNTMNGTEPILRLIGDLPPGTPVAFEAAFGWSWLARLLEDYSFEAHLVHPLRCKAIASARLKNAKGRRRDLGPTAARRPAPGSLDRAAGGAPAPSCCGTGPGWSGCVPGQPELRPRPVGRARREYPGPGSRSSPSARAGRPRARRPRAALDRGRTPPGIVRRPNSR
jgi:hypothetical protein